MSGGLADLSAQQYLPRTECVTHIRWPPPSQTCQTSTPLEADLFASIFRGPSMRLWVGWNGLIPASTVALRGCVSLRLTASRRCWARCRAALRWVLLPAALRCGHAFPKLGPLGPN